MRNIIQNWRTLISEKFAGNFIKTLSLDVLAKGFMFVFLPLYTQVMTEEEFGLFTYLYLIITTCASVFKIGMDTAFSKLFFDVGGSDRKTLTFTVNIVWIVFFLTVFLVAMLTGGDKWIFSQLIEKDIHFEKIRFQLWVFVLLEIVTTTLNVYYLVNEKIVKYQIFNFFKIFITNFLTFALLYYSKTDKVALRLTSECLLGLLLFSPLIIELIKETKFKINRDLLDKALKIGFPMMGSLLISSVYLLADRYFIQKYNGLNSLAVYNFCVMLTLPISLFFGSFNTIWFPKFAKEKNLITNYKKTIQITGMLLIGFSFISIVVWLAVVVLLHTNLLKNTYAAALIILPIVFASRILDTLSHLYTNFVVVLGKTSFNFTLVLILGFSTLALNYFFTPLYGILAAAIIVFTISSLRLLALFLFAHHYSLKINP